MSKTINRKDNDWVSATIIDDDDDNFENELPVDDSNHIEMKEDESIEIIPVSKKGKKYMKPNAIQSNAIQKNQCNSLKPTFLKDDIIVEIGIDEAGRGPMFGRVYAGVVVLPKDDSFEHHMMKDSKKFHSKKKIEEVAKYIKDNAIAWAVEYEDEQTIDNINILQATQSAMHKGIKSVLSQLSELLNVDYNNVLLLVDGNYFKPFTYLNKEKTKMESLKYELIEGGDNKYTSIAAASILAKVERDKYIENLCEENPELVENYGIDSNKGYGSKKHMDGIRKHGITKWHRKTFGICKEYC